MGEGYSFEGLDEEDAALTVDKDYKSFGLEHASMPIVAQLSPRLQPHSSASGRNRSVIKTIT